MTKQRERFRAIRREKVTDDYLEEALGSIELGFDSEAAFHLIEYFHECFKADAPFSRHVFDKFIRMAFEKIVEQGWSADQAFGLAQGRGKYERMNTTVRDLSGVAYMILLMERGHTWLDARGIAANLLFDDGMGDKAMENAYKQHKEVLRTLTPEELMALLPDGAQL